MLSAGLVIAVILAPAAGLLWASASREKRYEALALAVASVPLVVMLWVNLASVPDLFATGPTPTLSSNELDGKLLRFLWLAGIPAVVAWGLLGRSPRNRAPRSSASIRTCEISRGASITVLLAGVVAIGFGLLSAPFQATVDTSSGLWSQVDPWLLIGLSMTGAIAEELLFRGVLLSLLTSALGIVVASVVQALAFGVVHLSYGDPVYVLAATLFGLLQAYVVRRIGILAAVVIHGQLNIVILGWSSMGDVSLNALVVAGLLAVNVFVAVSAGIACQLRDAPDPGGRSRLPQACELTSR